MCGRARSTDRVGGRSVVFGFGSDFAEEPVCRNESRPRWLLSRFLVSSRARGRSGRECSGVGDEMSVDGVADVSFQGADRFSFRLAFGNFAVHVVTAGRVRVTSSECTRPTRRVR